jgi:hypothetical protein
MLVGQVHTCTDGETGMPVATGVVPVTGRPVTTSVVPVTGIRLGLSKGVTTGWGAHAAIEKMISSKISEVFMGLLLHYVMVIDAVRPIKFRFQCFLMQS